MQTKIHNGMLPLSGWGGPMSLVDELNAIDPNYLRAQPLPNEIEGNDHLQNTLASAVRHASASHPSEIRWLLRDKVPFVFLVEFLGASETTSPTRGDIAKRWLEPGHRPHYRSAAMDRVFYIFGCLFVAGIVAGVGATVMGVRVFNAASVIGLLTIALFALLADASSWWKQKNTPPILAPWDNTSINSLSHTVLSALFADPNSQPVVSPSTAQLFTHLSSYELRLVCLTTPRQRVQWMKQCPPTFRQMQHTAAWRRSYIGYVAQSCVWLRPYAWKRLVENLNY